MTILWRYLVVCWSSIPTGCFSISDSSSSNVEA